MARDGRSKRKDGVGVDGPWLAMPVEFLASRACAELSPHALKLLFTLMAQLKANHYGNGRLDLHKSTLRAHGWSSDATARAAIAELIEAELVVCTRQGYRGSVGLYAVTLFPMHCKHDDLDHGPNAWSVSDWRCQPGAEAPPTCEKPARWRRSRAQEKRECDSRDGKETNDFAPAAGAIQAASGQCTPAAGAQSPVSTEVAFPLREPPFRHAISRRSAQRMASLMASVARRPRPAAYATARARLVAATATPSIPQP